MKKILFITILIISLTNCKNKSSKDKDIIVCNTYDVVDVKVDDDGEFHVVGYDQENKVITLTDVRNRQRGFHVFYNSQLFNKPLLTECKKDNWRLIQYTLILPKDYKLEIIND